MRQWLKEPLLHFLLLGVLIFAAYAYLNPGSMSGDQLVVSEGQQRNIITTFSRTWQRNPTQEEFDRLVDDWIREEVAYRESLNMGLDANDTIIRRRLRQKLELLAEDVVSFREPTDEELQAFLEANQQKFQAQTRFTLKQIYFSPDRREETITEDIEQTLTMLRANPDMATDTLGDPLTLMSELSNARARDIARQFGMVFVEGLQDTTPGTWAGPIASGYGLHLVLIEEVVPARDLTLDEARDAVLREWTTAEQKSTLDQLYDRLTEGYEVIIEPLPAEAAAG